jgi:hypothetical protein
MNWGAPKKKLEISEWKIKIVYLIFTQHGFSEES